MTVKWANHLVKDAQGLDPHHPAEGRVLHAPDRQRDRALEFRADQSRTLARDARLERRQSRARHAHAGRGHRGRRRRTEDPPDRHLDVRGRPQPRGHARQGDLPERPDPAHPVCADDRKGAQAPGPDRAALDQQVLRARPQPGEILHQMVRRPGTDGLRHLLGQSGRAPRQEDVRGLRVRRPARRARRDQERDRRQPR